MTTTQATVIADSISPLEIRLTTMQVTLHRFVLAEFNTHRVFSRNSASSRAIPVNKMLERYYTDPAYPIYWGSEKPGMQAGDELTGEDLRDARDLFAYVNDMTYQAVEEYVAAHPNVRLHKSVINRLLEPFMWHTVIVTSTEWDNFFGLRCHELAQPEIRVAAETMRDAMAASEPTFRSSDGDWHTPFATAEEFPDARMRLKASAARCAWVSTMSHDGDHSKEAIERMYSRLTGAVPWHASPFEHQALPETNKLVGISGNFRGWRQLRHLIESGLTL
jgi:thymidylate synthase ThyX